MQTLDKYRDKIIPCPVGYNRLQNEFITYIQSIYAKPFEDGGLSIDRLHYLMPLCMASIPLFISSLGFDLFTYSKFDNLFKTDGDIKVSIDYENCFLQYFVYDERTDSYVQASPSLSSLDIG